MTDNGYHIYINEDSGTARKLGRKAIEDAISKSGIGVTRLYILNAEEIIKAIDNLETNDRVLIGGGDGTIRSCAENLYKKNIAFGILPFGTMNLLAQDIGLPNDFKEALDLYAQKDTTIHPVDIGIINGKLFLCCVGLGVMPAASKLREQNRKTTNSSVLAYAQLATHIFEDFTKDIKFKLKIDNHKRTLKSPSVVISNNIYHPKDKSNHNVNFTRTGLQDGKLGFYSIKPRNFFEKIDLIKLLKIGNWKKARSIQMDEAKHITVNLKNNKVLVSIDGEILNMRPPLALSVEPKALNLIVPAHEKEQAQ